MKSQKSEAETRETTDRNEAFDAPEIVDKYIFICLDKETDRRISKCTKTGLNSEQWPATPRGIRPDIAGRPVVVVSPSTGPGRKRALEVVEECHAARASIVRTWVLHGLGEDAWPDIKAYCEQFDLGNLLWVDKPWLPELPPDAIPIPSANGNGRYPIVNGIVNYSVLTAAELNVLDASEIKVKKIDWVWPYRLAAGEMSLLAGEGGLGKSQILLWIAAAISRAWEWPDGSGAAPLGRVLLVTAEDSPETTIKPRLMALGADLTRIKIIPAPKVMIAEAGKDPVIKFQWLTDHGYWQRYFDLFPDTKLMIMDPIVSYLGRGVNDQRNDEVRTSIEPFLEVVIRPRGIAFLANTHLNKSLENKNMVHRITGSIAYVNLPRNVHVVFRDPDNPELRIFGQCKSNNAPDDLKAFSFKIVKQLIETDIGEVETSMPQFEANMVALDLKRAADGKRGPRPTKSLDDARWLYKQLELRPLMVRTLVYDGQQAGILPKPEREGGKVSISPLYAARDRLPDAFPGWEINELEIDGRKAWELVRSDGAPRTDDAKPPF
jgi:putative DNA primase/helicase